jgi:ribulose-phosphate 3-epimerase
MIEFSIQCLQRFNMMDKLESVLPLVDSVHLDIMDGEFVPNTCMTVDEVNKFPSTVPKHVHILAYQPEKYIPQIKNVESITFSFEATSNPLMIISKIKSAGFKAGICIHPETPPDRIADLIPYVDRVVVMAVRPGYSGQPFIEGTPVKVKRLRALSSTVDIVVDGGMHEQRIQEVIRAGATSVVVCTVIIKAEDWKHKVNELKKFGYHGLGGAQVYANYTMLNTNVSIVNTAHGPLVKKTYVPRSNVNIAELHKNALLYIEQIKKAGIPFPEIILMTHSDKQIECFCEFTGANAYDVCKQSLEYALKNHKKVIEAALDILATAKNQKLSLDPHFKNFTYDGKDVSYVDFMQPLNESYIKYRLSLSKPDELKIIQDAFSVFTPELLGHHFAADFLKSDPTSIKFMMELYTLLRERDLVEDSFDQFIETAHKIRDIELTREKSGLSLM